MSYQIISNRRENKVFREIWGNLVGPIIVFFKQTRKVVFLEKYKKFWLGKNQVALFGESLRNFGSVQILGGLGLGGLGCSIYDYSSKGLYVE